MRCVLFPGPRHLLGNGVDGVYFPACLSNGTHAAASCEAPVQATWTWRTSYLVDPRGEAYSGVAGEETGVGPGVGAMWLMGGDRTLMQYTYHYLCQANGGIQEWTSSSDGAIHIIHR